MAKSKLNEHKAAPWVITDFETGGIDLSKYAITEISMTAVRGDTLEEIGKYSSLIKPYGYKYDEKAFEKTGLSEAKLEKEGKHIEAVIIEVIDFLQKVNIHNSKTQHRPILVAHNALFENQCFQHLFSVTKKEKELEKLLQGMNDFHGNYVLAYLDTIQIARMIWAANIRMQSFSLESICERAGVQLADGHRADADVLSTTEWLKWAIKLLRAADSGAVVSGDKDGTSFRDNFHFQY